MEYIFLVGTFIGFMTVAFTIRVCSNEIIDVLRETRKVEAKEVEE